MRQLRTFGWILAIMVAAAAPAAASVSYGVRLGANLADLRGDLPDIANPKMKVGTEAGLSLDYSMSSDLALQLEADYVSKGATFESEYTDDTGASLGTFDSKLKLQYIEVPLLVRATFRPWGHEGLRPYLIGGPTMSFALKATLDNPPVSGQPDPDLTDDMKKILLGVTGGLGLRFPTQLVGLAMEARYRTDFGDLWDLSGNLESINQGVSLTFVFSPR